MIEKSLNIPSTLARSVMSASGGGEARTNPRTSTGRALHVDEALALRFRRGDREAFEAIHRIEGDRLGRFITRYVGDADLAEDIYQETWIRAWTRRTQLRRPGRFASWFYSIARNSCLDVLRKRSRHLSLSFYGTSPMDADGMPEKADPAASPEDSARVAEWKEVFDRELSKLDLVSQEIMALRFQGGLNLREIAETLDMPLGTVASRLSASLRRIRKAMERQKIEYPL